jgi:hypothetical protein
MTFFSPGFHAKDPISLKYTFKHNSDISEGFNEQKHFSINNYKI